MNQPTPTGQSKSINATTNTTSQKLRDLNSLKNEGLITEDDYQQKKKQLLEQF